MRARARKLKPMRYGIVIEWCGCEYFVVFFIHSSLLCVHSSCCRERCTLCIVTIYYMPHSVLDRLKERFHRGLDATWRVCYAIIFICLHFVFIIVPLLVAAAVLCIVWRVKKKPCANLTILFCGWATGVEEWFFTLFFVLCRIHLYMLCALCYKRVCG